MGKKIINRRRNVQFSIIFSYLLTMLHMDMILSIATYMYLTCYDTKFVFKWCCQNIGNKNVDGN
jgi:hypothetical protein